MTFGAPETIEVPGSAPELEAALERVPDRAAVFLIWPREGSPYLARTSLLRRRLRRLLRERAAPTRALNLREVASRIEYWPAGSRLETALLFYDLAVRHFPGDYARLVKMRMPPYLKVLLSNAFPRTQVTARLGGSGSMHYGPFRTRGAAEQFEAEMLDLFQVRRCQEDLEPSPAHPGCIYGEMGKCLRPCQQVVSADEYRGEVDRVAAFLATDGRSLTDPLESARERLSDEMDFEEAARVHRQIEKIQQVVRLREDLVRDVDRLHGVAVTAAAEPGAAQLWFVLGGAWHSPVRFGFDAVEGKTVSLDHRLREIVASLEPPRVTVQQRQEHLALLARWYYSSWRDGEWVSFPDMAQAPYRRLVRAISRVLSSER